MNLHAGDPSIRGSRCIDGGVNFVVATGVADGVDLCLFDDHGREIRRLAFTERHGEFWHGFLPGASTGLSYGYRVHGRYDPEDGLFFEPARLLVDPWAERLTGTYRQHPGHFPGEHGDTAPWTPKSVVGAARVTTSSRRPLIHAPFIYEAHVRGLTRLHPGIPERVPGTYAALGHPVIIQHLQRLGVDALELLPVQCHIDEPHLVARGLRNYWGYSPIGCPALHPDYAANPADPIGELALSIRALHAAGIEVILDVVFNHTAEGGSDGPVFGMRGFDPHLWYLHQGGRGQLADFTGCGNTLNVTHPVVADWIVDNLRFWCETLDVDGFRFDLATTLGRQGEGFDAASGLLARLASDPVLGTCRLIAEPWDIGPHGYRLGAFGAGWQEWNDRFRDGVRSYWKGDPGAQAELGRRLHGSSDLFEASGRTPAASINFITAHDGFCLQDLVSFNHKHNLGNGEDNRDGTVHNLADNLGHEGPSDDPVINQRRERRKRAMLTTLLLAEGSPMMLAGDELGHSQAGNNNAYCQDNELSWLRWPEDAPLTAFIGRLVRLRAERTPVWSDGFVHATFDPAITDEMPASVAWYSAEGLPMTPHDWHRDDVAFALLRADAERLELCLFNRAETPVRFRIPAELAALTWRIRLDSASPDGSPRGEPGAADIRVMAGLTDLDMEGQSVVVMDCPLQGKGNTQ